MTCLYHILREQERSAEAAPGESSRNFPSPRNSSIRHQGAAAKLRHYYEHTQQLLFRTLMAFFCLSFLFMVLVTRSLEWQGVKR